MTYSNSDIQKTIEYIVRKVYLMDYPAHYPFSYWDDIFTPELFALNSMWLDPLETIPFATILSYADAAIADYAYYNFPLEIYEVKDKFKALELADTGILTRISAAETSLAGKASTSHTHSWASITDKPTIPSIITSANIADASTSAPTNAAVNAPTNSKTDYNVLTTLLGTLTDGLNQTNTTQNSIASIVNANATKQNTIGTILNSVATKLNLTFDSLEANSILAA